MEGTAFLIGFFESFFVKSGLSECKNCWSVLMLAWLFKNGGFAQMIQVAIRSSIHQQSAVFQLQPLVSTQLAYGD